MQLRARLLVLAVLQFDSNARPLFFPTTVQDPRNFFCRCFVTIRVVERKGSPSRFVCGSGC